MKPARSPIENTQRDLFRSQLENIISKSHSLVKLSRAVNWEELDRTFGATFCEDNGRPGIPIRLMTALHYLKFAHNLSDEAVVESWVENPYWQYFSGMKYFEHELPCDPSSMTRWRKRIGEAGAEELLKKIIESGLALKAVRKTQLMNIHVDTRVKAAKDREINLRQNYNQLFGQTLLKHSRYAHAKQMKSARKATWKLTTCLGSVIRYIQRKYQKRQRA